MFNREDLENFELDNKDLFDQIDQYLLENRLGIVNTVISKNEFADLSYFSSAVLGSIATEENIDLEAWKDTCKKAADIEYMLFWENNKCNRKNSCKSHLLRAAILYELAGYHSITALMGRMNQFENNLKDFLSRDANKGFGKLGASLNDEIILRNADIDVIEKGIEEVLQLLESYMQNFNKEDFELTQKSMNVIKQATMLYNFNLNTDEILCLKKLMEIRGKASVSNYVPKQILDKLKCAKMPSELWKSQIAAVNGGLVMERYDSWGLATPTGTGKTALAQILLVLFFHQNPRKKAFYIVPSKALATQVSSDLSAVLEPLGYKIAALGSHLTYNEKALEDPKEADLLVFTPEKADLILRIERELLNDVNLVIVDEAHHIEAGTRGMLLEFYLWRVKQLVPKSCRIIQLSAVAPNINELVGWLSRDKTAKSIKLDWRPGKFRIGTYEGNNDKGILNFDTIRNIAIENYKFMSNENIYEDDVVRIGNLAHILSKQGLVLVLAISKSRAEKIAKFIEELRSDFLKQNKQSELTYSMESLDAKLERELYAEVPLRSNISFGVAYHHGGLPSRVRYSVEQVIKEKKVNVVCSTTTLAEGVNFPFSAVIVESLIIGRSCQLSPRELWNIAGRAGRFGVDSEGHCILYSPSSYKNKLKNYKLSDYLDIKLDSIPPVKSAFAESLNDLVEALNSGKLIDSDLQQISLKGIRTKIKGEKGEKIVGMINMYRVGLTHAHASKLIDLNKEIESSIIEDMYALNEITEITKSSINKIETGQRKMLADTLLKNNELVDISARIGWTIESQNNLWIWVRNLEDWQITSFGNIVDYSNAANIEKLKYLLYPVAQNMTEFEGNNLGGFTSYIAKNWICGYSLTDIRIKTVNNKKLYDYARLVDLIYSRIQYLLPWALYGVNDLLEYEARKRNIPFGSGVKDLSILSSEGVPNFDALLLCMKMDIERVDATRLSHVYRIKRRNIDIINWFKGLKWNQVYTIVRGDDGRRIDPDLKILHENLKLK